MTTRTECARLVMGLVTAALVALGGRHPAQAAGVVGTGTAGSCTESALDTALSGGGLVTFNCGAAPVTIALTTTKTINTDTTVDGGRTITLGGTPIEAFNVLGSADFTVRNLTIAGTFGIAINNISTGTVTATNCTFSGHTIDINDEDTGGPVIATDCTFAGTTNTGILNNSTSLVTAANCTFASSDTGINNDDTGMVTAANCTFSGNTFYGIRNNGTATATNCTFFLDSVGISNAGIATATNCTFSNNQRSIFNAGTATATNCILAAPFLTNCSGSVTDGGHNLDSDGTCGFASGTTNPQLNPAGLQNHGGPTQTIAVLATSPAINAGDQAVCASPPVNSRDQRSYVRPGRDSINCTIGAFEFAASPPLSSPALSPAGLLGLAGLLAAGGSLALSRRRVRP